MAQPATESVTLPVLGMTCAACQHHVEEALRSTEGVESARVDLMAHRASVVFDPSRARPEALVAAIRGAGYDAVLPRPDVGSAQPGESQSARRTAWIKAITMLVAGAIAMVLAMPLGGEMGSIDHALMQVLPWLYAVPPDLLRWTLLAMTSGLMVWAGGSIFANAARGLRHGTTNMNTLVALGTSVAFLYSAFATIRPAANRQVYFDAVLLILGFLLLGKALESRAKRRALAALDSLSRLRPVNARRIVDGVETVVPLGGDSSRRSRPDSARRALPVDATILEGRTSVDESMLTGESTPLAREPGGRVLAGSLNYDGAVVCRAESLGEATVLAQITRMVEQAQSSRAPMERLADRASVIFVPVVLGLAFITFLAWVAGHAFPSTGAGQHRCRPRHCLSLRDGPGCAGGAYRGRWTRRATWRAVQGRRGAGAPGASRRHTSSTRPGTLTVGRPVLEACICLRATPKTICCVWRRQPRSAPTIPWHTPWSIRPWARPELARSRRCRRSCPDADSPLQWMGTSACLATRPFRGDVDSSPRRCRSSIGRGHPPLDGRRRNGRRLFRCPRCTAAGCGGSCGRAER